MAWLVVWASLLSLVLSRHEPSVQPDFSEVEVVTFDFYAALMDTVVSLQSQAVPILIVDKVSQNMTREEMDTFVKAWAGQYSGYVGVVNALQHNQALQWADKDLFKMMLNITLEHTCMEKRLALQPRSKVALIDAWRHLRPWRRTVSTLQALRAARGADGQPRFQLATLSNADHEFLKAGCHDLEVESGISFDAYLGCDGLGVAGLSLFKPEPVFYEQIRNLVLRPDYNWKNKVLHVAGAPYDANGAKAFGFRTAWNANSSRPVFFDYTGTGSNVPDVILHDIGELPAALGLTEAFTMLV